jgi:predicted Zn-dependent peptidase
VIRKDVLDNGLTLLTESMHHVRSVTVGVWLRRGSRNEPAALNGISHFIEHLVFKGTASRTAREIALSMDSVGGQIDAFTSKEYTCFYAKVLDQHLEEAVDLLADIVQRPRFDPDELERERKVVLEEIRMVEDTPDDLIYDLFAEEFYPRQTLGRPIQGTAATIAALTRRQLLGFFQRSYRPENMLVVAAGNLRHGTLSRWVRERFGRLERARGRRRGERPGRPRVRCGVVTKVKNSLGQMHLMLGLPAFRSGFAERCRLHVLNTILGGTMSSRLFQRIREERGLAYSVYSALNAFRDTGHFVIYAATRPSSGAEVIRLALEELRNLRDQGPTAAELEVAREHLKGSMMLGLESTSSRMSNLARQEIYLERLQSLGETLRGIQAVTRPQVHRLCRQLLRDRRVALAAVGPVRGLRIEPEALVL